MKKILISLLTIFQTIRRYWLKFKGIREEEIHNKRIVEGKAWEEFCENLKAAGAALVYPGTPRDPWQQAEGVRYLSRLTRAALEAFVEYGDPEFPILRRTVHETIKMGADNPDNYYLNAQISGEFEYKITGKRNSVNYIGFFTQNGNYGTTGGLAPCGILEDLYVRDDDTFEIIISKHPRGENWLKLEDETSLLIVRQTFLDRFQEEAADLSIEAINTDGIAGSISPKRLDEGLNTASMFVAGAPILFANWAKNFQRHSNQLPLFDPEISNAAGGVSNIIYYHSHWKLALDEVLVIRTHIPDCDSWNFQLNNYWMESLDYRYHQICINRHTAHKNEDGTVTIIVAHQDPSHPNWIQTAGHEEGTMCWRWYRPKNKYPNYIDTEVVNIHQLKETIYAKEGKKTFDH